MHTSKRVFDIAASSLGGVLLLPVMVAVGVAIAVFSPGPVLFVQKRVGQNGKLFRCVKFRTMKVDSERYGTVTASNDNRITPIGRFLRLTKLDELPQLWNVLVGEMSLVGPRPDVPGFADRLEGEDRSILDLVPGMTGPATLLFRDEERLLECSRNPLAFNSEVVFPEKIRLNLEYAKHWSFMRDLGFILATIAPGLTKIVGIDRCLGLDYEAFRRRMDKAVVKY